MRNIVFGFSLFGALWASCDVHAAVVARVRAEGLVRCASAGRPGLAEPDFSVGSGGWRGLHVEICRAIAVAVLGPAGRFEFHRYETQKDYEAVSQGADAVFFLTASEIVEQNLAGKLIPGPAVYYESHALMVKANLTVRRPEDLTGARICFVIGSGAQRSLESFFEEKHLPFLRLPFSEGDEMRDAYFAGRCDAVADERTALARLRLQESTKADRILPEPLAVFPVLVCTATADGTWAAAVAWIIHTLVRGDNREGSWRSGGAKALPIDGTGLGLGEGWQKQLIVEVGAYGDIYRRTLGDASVYRLSRGLNAPVVEGGLFAAPYSE